MMTENEKIIPLPSLEYLLSCSQKGLQDVELASLNRAANCLKQAKIERDEACAYREAAGVARWLRENREALLQVATRSLDVHINSDLPNLVTLSGPKTGLDALLGASEEQKKKDSH